MKYINKLSEISNQYHYYIFDIWGVVHDGNEAYEGAVRAIKELRAQNKKICFLSNAPRRAKKVAKVLEKFGVTPDLYDFAMSSGEATYLYLEKNQNNNFAHYGKKYFYIGPEKDSDLLDGLDYQMTDNASDADFAVATGFNHDNSTIEEKLPQLHDAIKNNLKMICVNPDLIVVRQNGTQMLCAGELAKKYKELGGQVTYFGKPHEAAYTTTISMFGENIDKSKILAIGDSLETDIKGSNEYGFDNLLLSGGILSNQIDNALDSSQLQINVSQICDNYQIYPTYLTKFL